jgi:DNA-binding transcriptional LysR family regulator
MDRLDAMAAFVAAVDRGSLAAAARALNHSPAALTRAIAALEDRLGAQLLHRTTRALRLTPFGETYLATCRHILAELQQIERGAASGRETPQGLLTITAPILFGRLKMRPVLDRFLDENPAVTAKLLLLDRVVNIADEGIDLAVRLAHLPDSSLHATPLGHVRRVLCAAPAYLARHPAPDTPAGLIAHACIMSNDSAAAGWSFASSRGGRALQPVAIRPRLAVNAAEAVIESAMEGHGITRALSYQVAAHVAAGRLRLLLETYEPPPIPVHFVRQADRAIPAKIRAFIDVAAPLIRAELQLSARMIDAAP